MIPVLAIGLVYLGVAVAPWILLWRSTTTSASKTVKIGDLTRDLAVAGANLRASNDQRRALSLTVARQLREIRLLGEEMEALAIHLPIAGADALRARLDRLLSPPEPKSGDGPGPVPGDAPAPAGPADQPSPVPEWID